MKLDLNPSQQRETRPNSDENERSPLQDFAISMGLRILAFGSLFGGGAAVFLNQSENRNLLKGAVVGHVADLVRIEIKAVSLVGDQIVFTSEGGETYKLPYDKVALMPICRDDKPYLAAGVRYIGQSSSELEQMKNPGSSDELRPVGEAFFAGLREEEYWKIVTAAEKK
jgi:hypothetical protein